MKSILLIFFLSAGLPGVIWGNCNVQYNIFAHGSCELADTIVFRKYSILSECTYCGTGVELDLAVPSGSAEGAYRINSIICEVFLKDEFEELTLEDFLNSRVLDSTECFGMHGLSQIDFSNHYIVSLKFITEVSCGASTGSYNPFKYIVIDLQKTRRLFLSDVILPDRLALLEKYVKKYVRKGHTHEKEFPNWRIPTEVLPNVYRASLTNEFSLNGDQIIFFFKIDMKQYLEEYYQEELGYLGLVINAEEIVTVKVPMAAIDRFLTPDFRMKYFEGL